MSDETDGQEAEPEVETGSSLRSKLESTLGENRRLTEQIVELEAGKLLDSGEYNLVSLDDLREVSRSELAETASRLQTERSELGSRVLATQLGVEDLDQVRDFLENSSKEEMQGVEALRNLGGGDPPRKRVSDDVAPGPARLRQAFS